LNLPAQQQPAANGVRTPPQMSSPGLLRYRSAPSAMFGDHGSPDHAADTGFARLLSGHHHHQHHPEMRDKPPRPAASHFAEDAANSMASQQQLMYQSQQQMAAMEGLFRTAGSGGTDPVVAGVGGNDSLLRQSSSPAGFLNHLNMDNGYGSMLRAGMAGAAGGGGYRNGDARLKGQLSFSSRQGSVMSQISEMVGEEMGGGSSGDDEAGSNGGCYGGIPGYPVVAPSAAAGWDEPSPSPSPSLLTSDGLSGPAAKRRPRDGGANGAARQLKPQFSLPAGSKPSPSPEIAAIEKFLQFQDSVPCKIRAKRGCATHPRSIAERVRRTKISERIRKLQELVPNMEKQTNTSDMLDLAVDYIKELQMQVKLAGDVRISRICPVNWGRGNFN
uniref:BHLH domain-containing protein n=1 Tax=Aegilops tauschii subsp. strangulata TaxID=200361 RepID=A0A453L4C6_AEGTS